MAQYENFAIELSPDLQTPGKWSLRLNECSLKGLVGPKGDVTPTFTRNQLIRLRSRNGYPNLDELKAIGASVWQSLMNPAVEGAYVAAQAAANLNKKGLRVLVSIVGEEKDLPPLGLIRLAELPVEALWKNGLQFLAPSVATPISRSLQAVPDREPFKIALPLRILVIVAAPKDKPPANIILEQQAIRDALKQLGNSVELEFCDPPTTTELNNRLQKGFHVVHFIGHGAFDIQGDDPTPRAYICMEDPATNDSVPLDADTLEVVLRTSQVRLVVFTACSSAAPTPNKDPYPVSAFDGIAQRLLRGPSPLSAVVAMQFDLESEAAVAFSRCFYSNILNPLLTLDEIVSLCRIAIIALDHFGAGHRAWVSPVVYWRCLDGKVFEVLPVAGQLTDEARAAIVQISARIEAYKESLSDMAAQPDNTRTLLAPLRVQYQHQLEDLIKQRGNLLGSTVRLWGGTAKAGGTVECSITICLRAPAIATSVRFNVKYPSGALRFNSSSAAPDRPKVVPMTANIGDGQMRVSIDTPSEGQNWQPAEYAVGALNFDLDANQVPGVLNIAIENLEVKTEGVGPAFSSMDAVVFVSEV
jgi:hypothetical protein